MCNRKFLLFFLFILFNLKAFPAVFVVTSNADAGPGTLRDALTRAAANGSAAKDHINFNISDQSEAGRTITLVSQLPDVSSNLVIDGTTQLGATFGQSYAHIKIVTPFNQDAFTIFNGSNLNDVEFYGLYLSDYTNITEHQTIKPRIAINITHATNITIGDINKGNLINGFDPYTLLIDDVNFLSIKSNIIGISDQNVQSGNESAISYISNSNNISFGGKTAAEGNTDFAQFNFFFAQNATGINLEIGSNNFGVFKNNVTNENYLSGFQNVNIGTIGISSYGDVVQNLQAAATVNVNIENNEASILEIFFTLSALKGVVNFTNNYLDIDRDGVTPINTFYGGAFTVHSIPVLALNCPAQINIGSDDPLKKNFIAYSYTAVNSTNSANIFIRNNEYQCIQTDAYVNDNLSGLLPGLTITGANVNNGQTTLSGTADPGATIDIYSSESCTYAQCSIRKYVGTTTAGNNGNWNSIPLNQAGIFYMSSTINNRTSEYKTYGVISDHVIITNLRCNNTGSIKGLQVPAGVSYYWTDASGAQVSTSLDLVTNKAGKYQLHLSGGCVTSEVFTIADNRITIADNNKKITNPSCGQSTGSIKNLVITDPINKIKQTLWFDRAGNQVGNTTDINGLAAGVYTLKVFTTDGCETDYGPITLTNAAPLKIDQSNQVVQPPGCGQPQGSITNIQVSGGIGTLKYIWWNDQQQTVGTDKDLSGQPGGTYKLQVTDDSQCGPVYSTDVIIPEASGITLDETKATITPATCGLSNGSITGIVISGATTYTWTDATGKVTITPTPDLTKVPAGTYTLTASNATCNKTSASYTILQPPPTQYPAYKYTSESTCVNASTGFIKITVDDKVESLRWVNGVGQPAGTTAEIDNLAGGTYQLYLTDAAGCETLYNSYTIGTILPLAIIRGSEQKIDDQCAGSVGSIKNIKVEGGITPYTFNWTDSNGKLIAQTADLPNIGAGSYTLLVMDASGCGSATNTYTLQNQDSFVSPPAVNNVQLCSPGAVLLQVKGPSKAFSYRLYDSESSTVPIAEQANGVFKINADANSRFYVSQFTGDCESTRTPVHITIGIAGVDIANTFTPNGDGINDYWEIKNITNYPGALIQIFTRNGQKVFESKGYPIPFNGTYNGKKIPDGVYYYLINLGIKCNLLSGSLTIIR